MIASREKPAATGHELGNRVCLRLQGAIGFAVFNGEEQDHIVIRQSVRDARNRKGLVETKSDHIRTRSGFDSCFSQRTRKHAMRSRDLQIET